MPVQKTVRRNDLIEPELSFKLIGLLYNVSDELGPGLQERYYQKASAQAFTEAKISFREQAVIPLQFSNRAIGRYFADFIIENKIVLELKKGNRVIRKHVMQLLAYLKTTHLPLGILVYFGTDSLFFKRIVNFETFNNS